MKKIGFTLFTLFLALIANAQPPDGKAAPGTTYGEKIDAENAILSADLPVLLKTKDTLPIKIKASVLDVCPKIGCWMSLKVNDSTEAFVKMKDYGFFVPLDMIGKTVVLDGKAYIKTTSVSELKHYAEDAKKSEKEIDAITEPKKEIRYLASGIVVVE